MGMVLLSAVVFFFVVFVIRGDISQSWASPNEQDLVFLEAQAYKTDIAPPELQKAEQKVEEVKKNR